MSLRYVSPTQMSEYRQRLQLFANGAPSVTCIRSHYFADRTGVCDLTGAKEQEEIFVLSNRNGATLKVSKQGMQIVANVLEIQDADEWYQRLKEQRKANKEKRDLDEKNREEQRNAPKAVLFKRRSSDLTDLVNGKNKNS